MADVRKLIGAAAVGLSVATAAVSHSAPTGASEQAVAIENLQFSPQKITVKSGTRVTWTNKDLFPHTATAEHHAFDSKVIQPEGIWTWVAKKPGTYAYTCRFHPTMKGTVTVR